MASERRAWFRLRQARRLAIRPLEHRRMEDLGQLRRGWFGLESRAASCMPAQLALLTTSGSAGSKLAAEVAVSSELDDLMRIAGRRSPASVPAETANCALTPRAPQLSATRYSTNPSAKVPSGNFLVLRHSCCTASIALSSPFC